MPAAPGSVEILVLSIERLAGSGTFDRVTMRWMGGIGLGELGRLVIRRRGAMRLSLRLRLIGLLRDVSLRVLMRHLRLLLVARCGWGIAVYKSAEPFHREQARAHIAEALAVAPFASPRIVSSLC
jgi:hypothetical protein